MKVLLNFKCRRPPSVQLVWRSVCACRCVCIFMCVCKCLACERSATNRHDFKTQPNLSNHCVYGVYVCANYTKNTYSLEHLTTSLICRSERWLLNAPAVLICVGHVSFALSVLSYTELRPNSTHLMISLSSGCGMRRIWHACDFPCAQWLFVSCHTTILLISPCEMVASWTAVLKREVMRVKIWLWLFHFLKLEMPCQWIKHQDITHLNCKPFYFYVFPYVSAAWLTSGDVR